MHFKRNLMIGLLLWAVFGISNAFAQSHEHGHNHQNQVTSPFDKNKQTTSTHCQLKGHTHLDFCPHSILDKGQNNPLRISADCGGKTSGSIPNTQSFSTDFSEVGFSIANSSYANKYAGSYKYRG